MMFRAEVPHDDWRSLDAAADVLVEVYAVVPYQREERDWMGSDQSVRLVFGWAAVCVVVPRDSDPYPTAKVGSVHMVDPEVLRAV